MLTRNTAKDYVEQSQTYFVPAALQKTNQKFQPTPDDASHSVPGILTLADLLRQSPLASQQSRSTG